MQKEKDGQWLAGSIAVIPPLLLNNILVLEEKQENIAHITLRLEGRVGGMEF